MRRWLRAVRRHWKPFWAHVCLHPANYAANAVLAFLGLAFLAWMLHDPGWVGWACVTAEGLYFLWWFVLQIIAYRTCTGHRLDRSKTYDRKDIWKDRWPW